MSVNLLFMYFCVIFALSCSLARADTPVRQCADDKIPLPLMVQIDNCDEMPCDLWKGMESKIAIQFVATRNSMLKLTAKVHLTSLGVTIPYELDAKKSDVCDNLLHGAYCPLDAGEDVTYKLLMPVTSNQPEVPTRLQVTLHDAEKADQIVACFVADTRVKRPSSN